MTGSSNQLLVLKAHFQNFQAFSEGCSPNRWRNLKCKRWNTLTSPSEWSCHFSWKQEWMRIFQDGCMTWIQQIRNCYPDVVFLVQACRLLSSLHVNTEKDNLEFIHVCTDSFEIILQTASSPPAHSFWNQAHTFDISKKKKKKVSDYIHQGETISHPGGPCQYIEIPTICHCCEIKLEVLID